MFKFSVLDLLNQFSTKCLTTYPYYHRGVSKSSFFNFISYTTPCSRHAAHATAKLRWRPISSRKLYGENILILFGSIPHKKEMIKNSMVEGNENLFTCVLLCGQKEKTQPALLSNKIAATSQKTLTQKVAFVERGIVWQK